VTAKKPGLSIPQTGLTGNKKYKNGQWILAIVTGDGRATAFFTNRQRNNNEELI